MRQTLSFLLFGLVLLAAAGGVDAYDQPPQSRELAKFHQDLIKRYPSVPHISTDALAQLPRESVVFFDVRELSEYGVSHLWSAIRVSPEMAASEFVEKYRTQMAGKKVVFYCSVGERSSRLAEAVLEMADSTSFDIVNLEGGLFKWHNEKRVVFNAGGRTKNIHPFSRYWGRLLVHRDQWKWR